MTAFSGEERNRLGINTAQDIADFTPSVVIQDVPDRFSIRGVGRFTNSLGTDPGVGIYLDGVYRAESTPLNTTDFFIADTEILRGPQGTLFGKNTIGGAGVLTSVRPSDAFEGAVRIAYGSFNDTTADFRFSGPITDNLKFLVGTNYFFGTGNFHNIAPGQPDLNSANNWNSQIQLQWDISNNAHFWIQGTKYQQHRRPTPTPQITPYLTNTLFATTDLFPQSNFNSALPNPAVRDPFTVRNDTPGYENIVNDYSVTINADWTVGGVTLKYIGGWYRYDYDTLGDYDGNANPPFTILAYGTVPTTIYPKLLVHGPQHEEFLSHELTATSNNSGPFNWIFGLYLDLDQLNNPYDLVAPLQPQYTSPVSVVDLATPDPISDPAALPNDLYFQHGRFRSVSKAAFGQIDYQFSPAWDFKIGARYTKDHKHGSEYFQYIYWDPAEESIFLPALNVTPTDHSRTLDHDWTGWSGNASLSWRPAEGQMAYITIARGYKSGGFELGQVEPVSTTKPEILWDYELGYKATPLENLVINVAAYYYDYTEIQVPTLRYGQATAGGASVLQSQFINLPSARNMGLELESTWAATENLTLRFVYSYMNSRINSDVCISDVADPLTTSPGCGPGTINIRGNELPETPHNKLTLNGTYDFHLDSGTLTAIGTFSWTGQQYYSLFNQPIPLGGYTPTATPGIYTGIGPFADLHQAPDKKRLDMSFIWAPQDKPFTVMFSATNVLNTRIYNSYTLGAVPTSKYGPPFGPGAGMLVPGYHPVSVSMGGQRFFSAQLDYKL